MSQTYIEQEQLACEQYIDRCNQSDALDILRAVNDTIRDYSDEELVGLFAFLKQDPYFKEITLDRDTLATMYRDAQAKQDASEEFIIGAFLGAALGDTILPSNDFDQNWRNLKRIDEPYQPDPNKFDSKIVSYRLCTYKAVREATPQLAKAIMKLKTIPHHSKVKLKDVKELYKLVGLPPMEEKDTKGSVKTTVAAKFVCAGFVGFLLVGGLVITGGIPWLVGDLISGTWTFLMTVGNRIGQRLINNAADKEAGNTASKLGYTPANVVQMIKDAISFRNTFAAQLKRIGYDDDGNLSLDEQGNDIDEDVMYDNYEKKEYEYYKLDTCVNRIGYAINGMAVTCVALMKATNQK